MKGPASNLRSIFNMSQRSDKPRILRSRVVCPKNTPHNDKQFGKQRLVLSRTSPFNMFRSTPLQTNTVFGQIGLEQNRLVSARSCSSPTCSGSNDVDLLTTDWFRPIPLQPIRPEYVVASSSQRVGGRCGPERLVKPKSGLNLAKMGRARRWRGPKFRACGIVVGVQAPDPHFCSFFFLREKKTADM